MALRVKNLLDGRGITLRTYALPDADREERETHDRLHSGIRLPPPRVKEHRTFITCAARSETET